MKHLKLFENFRDIATICKKYGIENYTINSDGSVDVDGEVNLSEMGLKKLPIKFGKVTGNFYCDYNKLTSLDGAPKEVGENFNCDVNQLTSLRGAPKEIGASFYCNYNQLVTLRGAPKEVAGNFYCNHNQLITLEGSPKELGHFFSCEGNPIWNIYRLFSSYQEYQDSLDYNYLRGTDIVKSRFEEALAEIGETVPAKISGYNYI